MGSHESKREKEIDEGYQWCIGSPWGQGTANRHGGLLSRAVCRTGEGSEVWSMDLSNGWDWANLHHREVAEKMVETRKPDLLILCPPCGPLSALQNLTPPEKRKNPEGYEREVLEAKSMVRWCFKMAEKQIQGGRHYLFESSKTSKAWSIPTVERFMEKYHPVIVEVSLCALGVRCPETQKLYGKAWRFVTSSRGIGLQLAPYHCDHQHEHQPVEGSSGGQMRSIQTQQYPKKLIRSILVGYHREEACDMCWAVSDGVPNEKDDPELRSESKRKIDQAIRKMHVNLGHASTKDMVRILRHAGAQEAVLRRVREFRCPLCEARKEPKIPRASAVPKDVAPLRYIGLDVKHLPGFKRHERIKALNIVDRVSGLQQMTPFRETESSEVLRRLYRQSWTKPYGRPKWLKFDASRCNLGQHFLDAIERDGTTVLDIPGEAHEQIGDVEVHGKHFESALNRVLDHMQPQNYDEWVECVDCLVEAQNSLMRRGGHSPYQLVLGRDPEFPGDDILCPKDGTDPITNSTILIDEVAERVHKTRLAARHSVIQEMDQQAARIALNSRPRPTREFTPGDEVAVWRRGRGIPGKMSHARWRGPGIVAGTSGNNYWVSMPGSFIKCSAEQLRYRTEEEGEADKFLVRDLRAAAVNLYPEVGGENRRQKNFLDITAEDYPPGAGPRPPSIPHEIPQNNENRADPRDDHSSRASTSGISKKKSSEKSSENRDRERTPRGRRATPSGNSNQSGSMSSREEIIQQMTPAERMVLGESERRANRLDGLPEGTNRFEGSLETPEPDDKRMRVDQQIGGQTYPPSMPAPPDTSAMVVESAKQAVTFSENKGRHGATEEEDFVFFVTENDVLIAGGRKEINLKDQQWNTPEGKEKIKKGLAKEANTVVVDKSALRPLNSEEAARILQDHSDRIVESRIVLTEKIEDDGQSIVKARWTARGDLDPDVFHLVREGKTQAPTISSNGRFTVLQTIASKKYRMQLGDVTGAFLETDTFRREQKLFLRAPRKVKLPGYEDVELFEVVRPLYGLNDSPQQWFIKFKDTVKRQGWVQSKMDHCVFMLWKNQRLCGVMGVHVDDVIMGGNGNYYQAKEKELRSTFPFRKWKSGEGEFCGSHISQCSETGDITISQEDFAEKMVKPKLRARGGAEEIVNKEEARSLKSVLGAALWLARESRPDLAVQVSRGQQLLPQPNLQDARTVGNITRRAKQYKNMTWKIRAIPFDDIRLVLHSDAAFANAKKNGTQGGYIIRVTDDRLRQGKAAPWSPATWKSYRLKRVVGSTFAGESQVLLDGLGHIEWIACHLAEMGNYNFNLASREEDLAKFHIQSVVDCKSIFDHLQSFSSPGTVTDKRVAIDLVIIRETLRRVSGTVRWAPTWLQLADALTKETPEAMDILRAAMRVAQYQLSQESVMMDAAAKEREARKNRTPAQKEAARKAYEARADKHSSTVAFVQDQVRDMVKVSTAGLNEEEVRALFEGAVSACVKDEKEYLENVIQNMSTCKVKIPLQKVNGKEFTGLETKATLTFTKTTRMITVNSGAAYIDQTAKKLEEVLEVYKAFLNNGEIKPLPDGSEMWHEVLGSIKKRGARSAWVAGSIQANATASNDAMLVGNESGAKFTPEDEEFKQAIGHLVFETGRVLANYPTWRNKILDYLVKTCDASTDQVAEIVAMTPQDEEWSEISMQVPIVDHPAFAAKAKAQSYGYRG